MARVFVWILGGALVLASQACMSGKQGPGTPKPGGPVTKEMLKELTNDVKEIVRVDGCTQDKQCEVAPVGERACGGPHHYIAYCSVTTNEKQLDAKLDELREAEERYNKENDVTSTCEVIEEPEVRLIGGKCQAVSYQSGSSQGPQ